MADARGLDAHVRGVLRRLEHEDAVEREAGVPRERRSRQVAPTTGRFLLALAALRPGARVLEIGASRGYSSIWLAAGARVAGGRVTSLEHDADKCEAWLRNIAEAGLDRYAELVAGDARVSIGRLGSAFDLVFLDAEKEDYEDLFRLVRALLEPGSIVVADNVLSHVEALGAYSAARRDDPTLVSVTVPLDRGLELSTVLAGAADH